tara:strand:+ start:119 stop:772 length:654 start_codon:yes stop_codon:yes gene_type:complete
MGFSGAGAMSGASAGMAFGPWGAVAGGILGGFLGDSEPDPYTAEMFKADTQPYQDMINKNTGYGEGMMDVNSQFNMSMKNSLLGQGLDSLALQNTLAQRNNAQQGVRGVNAMTNATLAANAQSMRSDTFDAFNKGYQRNLGIGQRFLSDSMKHQGDLSMSLAELGMANAGIANQHKRMEAGGMLSGMSNLAGGIASMGGFGSEGIGQYSFTSPFSGG